MFAELSDVRVLDFTHHVAGPFCTKLFADFGAEVVKIEKPRRGDIARAMAPFKDDDPGPEMSALFLHLNTNKRSVALNLKHEAARDVVKRLVERSDIVVESFAPGVMASLGLGYDAIHAWNPRAVMVSVSNFGQTGPYRDYKSEDIISYAMGGPMLTSGPKDGAPYRLGLNVSLHMAGNTAALAAMVALYGAEARGEGEHVDVSILETIAGSQERAPSLIAHQYTGATYDRGTYGPGMGFGTYPCSDGYIHLAATANVFNRLLRLVGWPESDERVLAPGARADEELRDEFDSVYMLPWLLARTKAEAWADLQAAGIPSGAVFTTGEVVESPHYRERGYFTETKHPVVGTMTLPRAPFRVFEAGNRQVAVEGHVRPAPLLGEHTREVLGELRYSESELDAMGAAGVFS